MGRYMPITMLVLVAIAAYVLLLVVVVGEGFLLAIASFLDAVTLLCWCHASPMAHDFCLLPCPSPLLHTVPVFMSECYAHSSNGRIELIIWKCVCLLGASGACSVCWGGLLQPGSRGRPARSGCGSHQWWAVQVLCTWQSVSQLVQCQVQCACA